MVVHGATDRPLSYLRTKETFHQSGAPNLDSDMAINYFLAP